MRKLVYLGGPINGCTDEEAHGWRERVKPLLDAKGYLALDPMVRDYRGRENEPGIDKEIVEQDKADIEQSNILLMSCPKPSVGTSMEVYFGRFLHKRIICVLPEGAAVSPWLSYHATELFFGSEEQAVQALL
jgi:hypothetical protein